MIWTTPTPQATCNWSPTRVPGASFALWSRTSAANTLKRSPECSNQTPGQGVNARINLSIVKADWDQSMRPSDFSSLEAYVTPSSGCGIGVTLPKTKSSKVETIKSAPIADNRSCNWDALISASSSISRTDNISPVSNPTSICMIVTPDFLSPAWIARWKGAAPRQRGKSDAWILIQPNFGASKAAFGKIKPYATTTATSAFKATNSAWKSSDLNDLGVRTCKPWASAKLWTGLKRSFWPRPAGRGGWE